MTGMIEKVMDKLSTTKTKKGKWQFGRFIMPCPGCGDDIKIREGGLVIRAESTQRLKVKNFMQPMWACDNPFCKWSKVKIEFDTYFMGYY